MLDEVMPDPKRRRGLMLVMSSPSGAGKTSISRRVLELEPELELSISVTTRPQRPGETDGVHYLFIDAARFAAMAAGGELLEHARGLRPLLRHPAGRCRGGPGRRPRRPVRHRLAGRPAAPRRRVRGHGRRLHPAALDLPELERRLRGRAQDPEEIVRYRLTQVASDVTHWPEYDYVLVNKNFDASVAAVRAILAAERLRRKRQPGLTDFVQQFRAMRRG